jgi:hypothetical protein
MSTITTDIWGSQATVGRVAPVALWSVDAVASRSRHHLAASKPMSVTAYEVKTINGFDRRPSEGST